MKDSGHADEEEPINGQEIPGVRTLLAERIVDDRKDIERNDDQEGAICNSQDTGKGDLIVVAKGGPDIEGSDGANKGEEEDREAKETASPGLSEGIGVREEKGEGREPPGGEEGSQESMSMTGMVVVGMRVMLVAVLEVAVLRLLIVVPPDTNKPLPDQQQPYTPHPHHSTHEQHTCTLHGPHQWMLNEFVRLFISTDSLAYCIHDREGHESTTSGCV